MIVRRHCSWLGCLWWQVVALPNKLELDPRRIATMARGPLGGISVKAINKLDAFGKVSGPSALLVCCPDVAAIDIGRCQNTDEDGSPT